MWEDSRRLFGASLWLDAPGVVLEAHLDAARADAELAAYRERAESLTTALGWASVFTVRRYGDRAALAFTAPIDALFTATLVNEWAWTGAATDGARRAAAQIDPEDPGDDPWPLDHAAALEHARSAAVREANEGLRALARYAHEVRVPFLFDDEVASVGYGVKSHAWPVRELPDPERVDRRSVGTIPTALVTGSNGKTTTVRLVAAMLARAGHTVGYCCSDGVFIGGECIERGDWSGPAGARLVLRDRRVTAAVLETARGGLLRRGLVVPRATAAIVTNIAEDHFGGYGIHSLRDLADAKLVVARALSVDGSLVLNAEDPTLRAAAEGAWLHTRQAPHIVWFDAAKADDLLPPAAEMPFTLGGAARHNLANAAGAALVAKALGVSRASAHAALRDFGRENADNAGRLERFEVHGVRVWVDYAHNPHGLGALLHAAGVARGEGRLGLLLGQAGDREDDAIRALARTAWDARPAMIVLKDLEGYMRGRAPGEIPALLRDELLKVGAPESQIGIVSAEADGVRALLAWAKPGDLLVLPVHALEARAEVVALLSSSH